MKWRNIRSTVYLFSVAFLLLVLVFVTRNGNSNNPDPVIPQKPIKAAAKDNGTVQADDDIFGSPYAIGAPAIINKAVAEITAPPTQTVGRSVATAKPNSTARRATFVADNVTYPMRVYEQMMTPNDPSAMQWWTDSINLPSMWDTPATNNQTILAVIDTGFALSHEEFNNRWYKNPGEVGPASSEAASQLNCTGRGLAISKGCNLIDDDSDGIVDNETGPTALQNPSRLNCTTQGKPITKDCNRIDDDGNGYIDDVTGWDFVNYDNSVQAGETNPTGSGTTHGTMTTGVAAATGNNGHGIAGVNWDATILPIQVLDDDSYGDTYGVGRAIHYAADRGAKVISISLGTSLTDDYVRTAVQYAISKGSVVVAAAGNDGCDCISYPANYPEVVSVGATDATQQRASFSSYGSSLDIVAPGTNITSSTWTRNNSTSAYASGLAGTSFSTPMVSGLLTKLSAQQPTATPLQLIAALKENTNRLSLPSTSPQTSSLGFGQVDAAKALQRMITPSVTEQAYSLSPVSSGDAANGRIQSEVPGQYDAQICRTSTIAGTPLYRLSNNSGSFFSISDTENAKAQTLGYSSSLLSYVCLKQPHDSAASYRRIDLYKELFNDYSHH